MKRRKERKYRGDLFVQNHCRLAFEPFVHPTSFSNNEGFFSFILGAIQLRGNTRKHFRKVASSWSERNRVRPWELPHTTSAKFSDFLDPPCHCHKSADFVPFVCFLGIPLTHPPRRDVIYGSPLSKWTGLKILPALEEARCLGVLLERVHLDVGPVEILVDEDAVPPLKRHNLHLFSAVSDE